MANEQSPFMAMDETLSMIRSRVMDCLDSSDLDKIMEQFASIQEPTIITGSGGSSVSAKFIATVLEEKNGIICQAKLPDEIWHMNLKPYKNILAVSGSGNNAGVNKAFDYAQNFGIDCKVVTHSDKFDKDANIVYGTSLKKEDSFISFANTIMPMALALCYYVGDKEQAKAMIAEMFDVMEQNPVAVKDGSIFEVIGKESCPTAAAFVESCLSESSIAVPVTSAKYDECHGRTTSAMQQKDRQIIYFMTEKESELDQFFHERFADNGVGPDRITDVFADFGDLICDDFYLTLAMANWCGELARVKGVDLTKMANVDGKRIHIPLDERAVEKWEEEHKESFWDRKPDWKGLVDVGKGVHSPGYYAPTGKFFDGDFGPTGRKDKEPDGFTKE